MIDYFVERIPGCRSISVRSGSTTTSTTASCVEAGVRPARSGRRGEIPEAVYASAREGGDLGAAYTGEADPEPSLPVRRGFRPRSGARAERRAARAGARGRDGPADRRALLLGFPEDLPWASGGQRDGRGRRREGHACTSVTATATESRHGKAATGTCFPRFSTPRCNWSRSSLRDAATRICSCSKEFKPPFALGLGVVDVKIARRRIARLRGRSHSPGARGRAGRAPRRRPRLRLRASAPRSRFQQATAMVEGTRLVRKQLGVERLCDHGIDELTN